MLIYWIWLAEVPGLQERERLAAAQYFGTPEDCYHGSRADYARVEGLSEQAQEALCNKDLTRAEEILAACVKKKIHILSWADGNYPVCLRNIPDPPLLLYYKGVIPDFDNEPTIGVVGTRKASAYGMKVAEQVGSELCRCGSIVVSGMAEGIDTMATQGALDAGGIAVGVLGCGADRIYPAFNRRLYRGVERQGCLISEYPPGTRPYPWNFPRRNRIISGLSCGLVVVEAPKKSGALITARQALEQGRDVYVIPGNVGVESCEGSNALLKEGATLVTRGWDILSEYTWRFGQKLHEPDASADKKSVDKQQPLAYSDEDNASLDNMEKTILESLGGSEQIIDTIIARTGIPSGELLAALTMLEVKGLVTSLPGGVVRPN